MNPELRLLTGQGDMIRLRVALLEHRQGQALQVLIIFLTFVSHA